MNLPARSRVQDGLASLLAERSLKVFSVVLCEVVARNRLPTILVYPLENLVAGGVTQTWEQRDELAAKGSAG